MDHTVEYHIGDEICRGANNKVKWLVARIVQEDIALVADELGQESLVKESYVMLKSELGEIDFIVLLHEDIPFTTEASRKVLSLPSLWRRNVKATT